MPRPGCHIPRLSTSEAPPGGDSSQMSLWMTTMEKLGREWQNVPGLGFVFLMITESYHPVKGKGHQSDSSPWPWAWTT